MYRSVRDSTLAKRDGRILRATAMDELTQLLNIFKVYQKPVFFLRPQTHFSLFLDHISREMGEQGERILKRGRR
jgi:hypothetical protein